MVVSLIWMMFIGIIMIIIMIIVIITIIITIIIRCLEFTNCDGVMSSEAILENPTLFSPSSPSSLTQIDIAIEYLNFCQKYPTAPRSARTHLMKMLHRYIQRYEHKYSIYSAYINRSYNNVIVIRLTEYNIFLLNSFLSTFSVRRQD